MIDKIFMWALLGVLVILIGVLIFLVLKRRRRRRNSGGKDMSKESKKSKKKKKSKEERQKEIDEIKRAVQTTEAELVRQPKIEAAQPPQPKPRFRPAPVATLPEEFDFPETLERERSSLLKDINEKLKSRTNEILGMINNQKTAIDARLETVAKHKNEIIGYVESLKKQYLQLDEEEQRYKEALNSLSQKERSLVDE